MTLLIEFVLGTTIATTGIVLLAPFVAFVGWIAYREYSARRPVWRNAEIYGGLEKVGGGPRGGRGFSGVGLPPNPRIDQGRLKARQHSPGVGLALAVLALVGLVVGSVVFPVTGMLLLGAAAHPGPTRIRPAPFRVSHPVRGGRSALILVAA